MIVVFDKGPPTFNTWTTTRFSSSRLKQPITYLHISILISIFWKLVIPEKIFRGGSGTKWKFKQLVYTTTDEKLCAYICVSEAPKKLIFPSSGLVLEFAHFLSFPVLWSVKIQKAEKNRIFVHYRVADWNAFTSMCSV